MMKTNLLRTLFSATAVFGLSTIAAAQTNFSDDFSGSTLSSDWTVVNPHASSSVSLTGNGELKVIASPLNGGADYHSAINFNAPRLVTPVSGNWDLKVKMRFDPSGDFEGAGILLLPDANANGTNGRRIFEKYYNTADGKKILNASQYHPYTDSVVYVHLVKTDTVFVSKYSADGANWSVGDTAYLSAPINYIGLHTIRKAYNANMKNAVAHYDYFNLTAGPTSAPDQLSAQDLVVYPNPATNAVYIKTSGDIPVEKAELTDQLGRVVRSIRGGQNSLTVSGIPAGIYFLKVSYGSAETTKKVFIR